MDLKNKIAIVTGSSMGIGKNISLALAKEGVKVVLAARSLEKLEEVKNEIETTGGEAFIVQTDLSKQDQIFNL